MSIRRIITVNEDDPVLRSHAQPVKRVNGRVRALMDDMVDTMRQAPGVGLAAPQLGAELRVVVVEVPVESDDPETGTRLHIIANPEITWASDEIFEGQEACLSIPGLYGDVPRAGAIRVRGLDRGGDEVEIDALGFEARIFQHEIDHLDGILFPDRVTGFDKLYHIRESEDGQLERVPYSVPTLM